MGWTAGIQFPEIDVTQAQMDCDYHPISYIQWIWWSNFQELMRMERKSEFLPLPSGIECVECVTCRRTVLIICCRTLTVQFYRFIKVDLEFIFKINHKNATNNSCYLQVTGW